MCYLIMFHDAGNTYTRATRVVKFYQANQTKHHTANAVIEPGSDKDFVVFSLHVFILTVFRCKINLFKFDLDYRPAQY